MSTACFVQKEAAWRRATNFSEFVVPAGGFASFNAFFTRQIRPGLRPVDAPTDPSVAVAPSEGFAWLADSNVQRGDSYQLKADNLDAARLLGYSALHEHFVGACGAPTAIAA